MKRYLLFVMLCVCASIGAWADVTFSQIASSQNNVSNGKGFTYTHTTYSVTLGAAGDLASYEYVTSGENAGDDDVQYGTYFTFTGPMNASDLAALSVFASDGNVTNDVYFDFSGATFVDADGNTLTDASIISSMNNSKVKYIILPDNTTDISNTTFPSNVLEAEAINSTTGQFLGYSSASGDQTLEHVLAFDRRYGAEGNTITDYTLTGTYSYQKDSNGNPITYSTMSNYNSVFGLIQNIGVSGYTNAAISKLDLTNATFPNYGTNITYTSDLADWTGDANALELINIFGESLTEVSLPTTVGTTLIPCHTFYNCKGLTSLEIPGNIKTLGMSAFEHCEEVTSITFNPGLTYMAPDAFYCCYKVTSISLPVGLTDVGEYAFTNCYKLEEIVIPEGVEVLGAGCFEYTNIKTVRLPNSLKIIEENVFRQCQKLKTITIPQNVEEIGSKAFVRCTHLTDVYFLGTTTIPKVPADVFGGDLYINNNACSRKLGTTSVSSLRGDYDEALYTQYGTQNKVDYSCWATIEDGVKTAGAAVLHYPVVSSDGYAEYDYATAYEAYQTALAAYNAAIATKTAEEIAAYEEALAKYYAAKAITLYSDQSGTVYTGEVTADGTYYVGTTQPKKTKIWAYQAANYPDATFYYLDSTTGEYVELGAYDSNFNYFTYNENLYVSTGETETVYTQLDAETQAILAAGEPTLDGVPAKPQDLPTVYTKSGSTYTAYSGEPVSGVTYYEATEVNSDLYGDYYTIPERNASYGGLYAGGDTFEEKHNIEGAWPDIEDLYCWYANGSGSVSDVGGRIGLPTPDGVDRDGLKNFLLVAGFPVDSPTSEVHEIDHIKKDVWYTMCFPFDLTDTQLQSCFGAGYEVAQFCSVTEKTDKSGIILNFTTNVAADANGVVTKKHIPYMIHPNSMSVNEDGTPKETVFTVTGVSETQEDHDFDQAGMMSNAVTVTAFDGKVFTFVGYGHNYEASSVLIPQYTYFLGTKAGETYPKYWRQKGENNRASGGYWNKNIAIVLPPTYSYEKIDTRVVNSDSKDSDGNSISLATLRGEEGYFNYVCSEYEYTPSGSSSSAKGLGSFDIVFLDDFDLSEDGQATGITEVDKLEKSTTRAYYTDKVYSMNGQYVGNSLEGLTKGIYIVNGKKYVVK